MTEYDKGGRFEGMTGPLPRTWEEIVRAGDLDNNMMYREMLDMARELGIAYRETPAQLRKALRDECKTRGWL
jgi:hypothetical protein